MYLLAVLDWFSRYVISWALGSIFTERPWRTVRYKEVYLNEYTTP